MKKSKLFAATLAMSIAIPSAVAPMTTPANAQTNKDSVETSQVTKAVSKDFKDVSKKHSAYIEIMEMRDQGIIAGYPDNTFRPAQAISRVHVASLFVRSLDLPPVRAGKEFKDVPKTSPYYDAVQTVYRAGIFDGNSNGKFGINENLTRAQMAKVLVNAFDLKIEKGYIFSDVGEKHWAKDYISSLYMSGITVGSDGKFMPNAPVSRAHYAAFLYRALNPELAPKPDKPLQPTPVEPAPEKPKPEITPPGTKPTPPEKPAPPVVKPTPPPVVKPEPKPEPPVDKPTPTPPPVVQPTPPVTPPTAGNPFPTTVKPPTGWTASTATTHESKVKETVFKYSPKVGTGKSFGIASVPLERFNDSSMKANIEGSLKNVGSSQTYNQWVDAVNQVIRTGGIYIAPDYSYAVYIYYVNGSGTIKFAH